MIKIGFIDYYLDEWHANNYPEMIKKASNGEIAVAYCWAEIDSPHGGLTSKAWSEKHGIALCESEDELIEKSDVLCVLAPDNPETHERLCQKALKSGKITYVDKTFAPDKETAARILAVAEESGTPVITSSALRYADEYQNINKNGLISAVSMSGGVPEIYMIHQIEPLVMLLGTDVKRVCNFGTEKFPVFALEYASGARTTMVCSTGDYPFRMTLNYENGRHEIIDVKSDFFGNFIKNLIEFYKTGEILVPHDQTLAVMAIREACIVALCKPDVWVEV
ncbi:MAG: hypothetical protein E7633_06785 [Ruminococcaceae bacterium]|nr:hypothetical protein [Oscillospiraceae bacterium]